MIASDRQRFQYRVDQDDNIVWVNSWWLAFARENDAVELANSSLVGQSLWESIADEQTRAMYRDIHERVRGNDQTRVVPFRCDSPTLKREMQLFITGTSESNDLLYEGRILRVTPTKYLSVLDTRRPRRDSFLTVCSCCKRVLLESYGWLDLEQVTEKLQLDAMQKLPSWRQTLCPRCRKYVTESVN